jgi:hypothetical protein
MGDGRLALCLSRVLYLEPAGFPRGKKAAHRTHWGVRERMDVFLPSDLIGRGFLVRGGQKGYTFRTSSAWWERY